MRNLPGWVLGAVGIGVVAGAFFLGGRLNASDRMPTPAATVASSSAPGLPGVEVECEPGQRAVVRQAATVNPGPATVACVSAVPVPVGYNTAASYPAVRYASQPYSTAPYVAPAPRMVRTSSTRTVSRAPAPRVRSAKSSVAIIAGGTAAGALIGAVADGKKGALIGGLIGGVGATVYDRTTRKKNQ
jgi:hypothetical protein